MFLFYFFPPVQLSYYCNLHYGNSPGSEVGRTIGCVVATVGTAVTVAVILHIL